MIKNNRIISLLLAVMMLVSCFTVSATPLAVGIEDVCGNIGLIQTSDEASLSASDGYKIKNIIVMIPDGAGFGNFDISEAVKIGGKGVKGQTTPITTDAISGMTSKGLYLSNFLIGTSKTYSASSSVTDSAAGGTAIATGNKTNNDVIALTPDEKGSPMASLLEASQIAGKSTGIVVTKFWFDATPASFASHAKSRKDYQQITSQMLNHNLNVLLGGGKGASYDGDIDPANLGYTVVNDKTAMIDAVESGKTKVWSNFNSGSTSNLVIDRENAGRPAHPTILDMTKAAIDILSENVNDPDGFFLMIEGSQVDSGGHSSNVVAVVSEYLAFDEAFAYAVEWARQDGQTLVVGVPDHDTGGYTPADEKTAIDYIKSATLPEGDTWDGNGNHTGQNVPIWAYGPDGAVEDLLEAMGLPEGGKDNARTGKFYRGVEFNEDYAVENTALAHGVVSVAGLPALDEATAELFVDVTDRGTFANGVFTLEDLDIKIPENANYFYNSDGERVDFKYGVSVYTSDRFYIPRYIAEDGGLDGFEALDLATIRTDSEVQGIRFASYINAENKASAYEYGYIVSTADQFASKNEYRKKLVFDGNASAAKGTNSFGVKFVSGKAYLTETPGTNPLIDMVYSTDGEPFGITGVEGTFFTAVVKNIPKDRYFDIILCRPYIVNEEGIVYGNVVARSIWQVAQSIVEKEYGGDESKAPEYIREIYSIKNEGRDTYFDAGQLFD